MINRRALKIYKSFFVDIIYDAGAGGEFLSALLLSHNSKLWKPVPMCAFLDNYSDMRRVLEKQYTMPFNTRHAIEEDEHYAEVKKMNDLSVKIVVDRNYLRALRKVKMNHFLDGYPFYPIHEYKATVDLDYFNPHKSYYEICEILEMEPDYKWFCYAYKNYFMWQRQFIRDPRLKNTIEILKKEVEKTHESKTRGI